MSGTLVLGMQPEWWVMKKSRENRNQQRDTVQGQMTAAEVNFDS